MSTKRKRHTPEQVVRKLTEADRLLAQGADTAEVARQLGVSEQTYFRWRNQFGGLKAEDAPIDPTPHPGIPDRRGSRSLPAGVAA